MVLFHEGEGMVNSLCSHVWYSCTRELCEVGDPSIPPFSPLEEFKTSVKVSCSGAQQDSPAGDTGWFESGQCQTVGGVSGKGCS